MQTCRRENQTEEEVFRDRCYGCYRPRQDCFCNAIPSIDNKTDVLILQHARERFHPFNTARIVQRALKNSRLLIDYPPNMATAQLPLQPGAGLLYPQPSATLISDLPLELRPRQLVIVDGTWHQAKTLVRDVPALRGLPQYRLAPPTPGRYRIRREPTATSLSTLEATVEALRALEPETPGLEKLLEAFNRMVERQLAHPQFKLTPRSKKRNNRTSVHIPPPFIHHLENVVVAYGESAAGQRGCRRVSHPPVYWVAQRLVTGERFACAIRPVSPLQDDFLRHLELTHADFADALSADEFRDSWAAFLRPDDALTVYNHGTARLLAHVQADFTSCLVMKSVCCNLNRRAGTLDELLAAEELVPEPAQHPGRAGKRLANAVALVRHLNALSKVR